MKEAVRRFRSRFEGWVSSLLLWEVRTLRELRPKMLRRLSLDIPGLQVCAHSPVRAQRRDCRIQKVEQPSAEEATDARG